MNEEYVKELNEIRRELEIDHQVLYGFINEALGYRANYNPNINDEELYEIIVEAMNRFDATLENSIYPGGKKENGKGINEAFASALKVLGYDYGKKQ